MTYLLTHGTTSLISVIALIVALQTQITAHLLLLAVFSILFDNCLHIKQ